MQCFWNKFIVADVSEKYQDEASKLDETNEHNIQQVKSGS